MNCTSMHLHHVHACSQLLFIHVYNKKRSWLGKYIPVSIRIQHSFRFQNSISKIVPKWGLGIDELQNIEFYTKLYLEIM